MQRAPDGHRRALEIFGSDTIRIQCQCGWKSLILPKDAAEAAYDHHLSQPKPEPLGTIAEHVPDSDAAIMSAASNRPQPPQVWYGICGYWTDDWSALSSTPPDAKGHGIPCCPVCGAVGFMEDAQTWWANVDAYEAGAVEGRPDVKPHPGYRAQVEADRGVCPHAKA